MKHLFVEEIKSGMLQKDGRIYLCTCGSEALVFEFPDNEDESWDEADFCNVAIWSFYGNVFDWKTKLRFIWQIVRFGHPYRDMVCLTKSQVKKINKLLTKKLKEKK